MVHELLIFVVWPTVTELWPLGPARGNDHEVVRGVGVLTQLVDDPEAVRGRPLRGNVDAGEQHRKAEDFRRAVMAARERTAQRPTLAGESKPPGRLFGNPPLVDVRHPERPAPRQRTVNGIGIPRKTAGPPAQEPCLSWKMACFC